MSELNTNLNISPYFNDYDETKNFHQILFKPATAVQARELTQLQTILQDQIARFGNNILQEGTIVQGGNFVEEPRLPYAKVRDAGWDKDNNVITVAVTEYIGMKARGLTTGLEGIVVAAIGGLESQTPNLATIYVRYTNNAQDGSDNNISTFSPTEEIQIQKLNTTTNQYENYHRLTAAGSVEANSTGVGHGVRCGDGIIFQKGYFVRFSDAVTVVGRYTAKPDGVVVGFETEESIVNSNADKSLLDNANGFNNYNAPGADRLKLTPKLVTKTLDEATADEKFFAVQEYQNGKVVRRRLTTQFDSVASTMARRTAEESGNYALQDYNINVEKSRANTSMIAVSIGSGVSYVEGQRVELVSDYRLDIPQASTYLTSPQQDVIANYGKYLRVNNFSGDFNLENYPWLDLKNSGGTNIGRARVRTITRESGNTFRIYLGAVDMNSGRWFKDVRTVALGSASATIILEGGKPRIKDGGFRSLIFPIGQSAIRSVDANLSDAVYRKTSTATADSNGDFTITLSGNEKFPYAPNSTLNTTQREELIVIAKQSVGSYSNGQVANLTSATVDSTGAVLTCKIAAPTGNMNIEIIHNIKKSPLEVSTKTLETVYVKIDLSTHASGTSGEYILGLPDAYKLEKVYRHSAYSESAAHDVTKHFRLDNGQNAGTYAMSRIKAKNSITLASGDKLVVKLKVFKKSSGVNAMFTVNSYPVDDASATLPADKIRTEDIPVYKEAENEFYLRDCLDARPHVDATAAYATTLAAATVNPSGNHVYTGTEFLVPNTSVEIQYSYYIPRRDLVVIDEYGTFQVVQGIPSVEPTWPAEPTKGMVLATLDVPAFPSLPTRRANQVHKPDYAVIVARRENRGYTMRDIGDIEKRIDRLEYYTTLSALETSAKDMVITDGNGLNRFKNGIFVDNFDNLTIADTRDAEYSAGIDPSRSVIHPKFRTYPIGLKVKSTTNTAKFGDNYTMEKSDKAIINQPYATRSRSCTTNFYKYEGEIQLIPEHDVAPDYTRAPDVNIDIDLSKPFAEFTDALSEFVPLQSTSTSTSASPWSVTTSGGGQWTTTTTSRTITTTRTTEKLDVKKGKRKTKKVGDFVTNVDFSPYMRSRWVRVAAFGLRPNTTFYAFFDGVDVNAHMAVGKIKNNKKIVRASKFGAKKLKSNAKGELYAIFRLPKETFFVGDRYFELSDLPNYNEFENATSSARERYSAFNFSAEKAALTTSTRQPRFKVSRESTTSTQVQSNSWTVNNWRGGGSDDPISQTFIVDPSESDDTTIMVSKMDLYFAKKGKNGVQIELREVFNGYPAPVVLPFSRVRLDASEVIANDKAAGTPTTITFPAPVALKKDTEYCFVVKPDGNDPDYRIWISKVGEKDVDSNIGVTQDTNAGTLFTSTNNKAWTAYQDENIKFKMYKCRFTKGAATIVMESNDIEFLDISNITKDFEDGEVAYIEKTSYKAGTVTVAEGSSNITGNGTTFTNDYNEGDYIVMRADNGEREVMKIESITNNTAMVCEDVAKRAVTGETQHYPTPAGIVTYFTDREPSIMILEESSARYNLKMANGDKIVGENTEASATITKVDDMPVSWFQANISKANFGKTRTTIKANKLWQGGTSYYSEDIAFGKNNHLRERQTWIRSKSNDANNSSFEITVNMSNVGGANKDTSTFIDGEQSAATIYQYLVNNDNTDEKKRDLGKATSKYISRRVELASGMEAEDVKVFLTAHRPRGTDVDIYVSFQSATDERNADEVEWTKLEPKAETYVYSSNRPDDFREMEFSLGSTAQTAGNGAWNDGTNFKYIEPSGAEHSNYKFFTVKIVMRSTGFHKVPTLKDVRAIALT